MAVLANAQIVVRKTFWELEVDDTRQELPFRPRSYSDHCVDYADLFCKVDRSDLTTNAGTSNEGSVLGSDDCESLGALEVAFGPPGVFAAPGQWIVSSSVPKAAGVGMCTEGQLTSDKDASTVIMVRNIPVDMSRAAFLEALDTEGFAHMYNFVYLPMDFLKGVRLGYAIVNFSEPTVANAAVSNLSMVKIGGKRLDTSLSESNHCLSDLILRYRDSAVMHWSVPDEGKPIIFSEGHVVPFPQPTKFLEPPSVTKPKKNKKNIAQNI